MADGLRSAVYILPRRKPSLTYFITLEGQVLSYFFEAVHVTRGKHLMFALFIYSPQKATPNDRRPTKSRKERNLCIICMPYVYCTQKNKCSTRADGFVVKFKYYCKNKTKIVGFNRGLGSRFRIYSSALPVPPLPRSFFATLRVTSNGTRYRYSEVAVTGPLQPTRL